MPVPQPLDFSCDRLLTVPAFNARTVFYCLIFF
jgi:hypothetical protein